METDLIPAARDATALRTPVVWFMALAATLGTASIYPLQPAIAEVAGSLHTSLAVAGMVPLVDQFAPRLVVSAQFGASAVGLAVHAVSVRPGCSASSSA
ncbi:hypothetical protein [Nocardia abscessus]|uniref:hypothetical protein n=1 Tax=Nocardia abscessus TaxID=120957 RepID=UPI002458CE20|nr:hypothetical protein [Nocardia abscessus]